MSEIIETIGGVPEILHCLPEQYSKCYIFQVIINLTIKLRTSDYKCILDHVTVYRK